MTTKLTEQMITDYCTAHPEIFKRIQKKVLKKQTKLANKRQYYAISKTELVSKLTILAGQHHLNFQAITKSKFAFTNPKTGQSVTFFFSNGKDYTIDPKSKNDLSNFIAKSWHKLDTSFLTQQTADYFVFFISRRLNSQLWAITFTYKELLQLLKNNHNFYFGITKNKQIIEDRTRNIKNYNQKHLGLDLIFNDPRLL